MSLTCRIQRVKDLRLEDDPPAELGPNDVEMRLGAGGICGSDPHYRQHGRVGAFVMREPLIPGHEVSGTVARIGSAVTRVKIGDKVAINPSHACGLRDYCRDGRLKLCRNMHFLGGASVYPHVQGMFRERFVMGERHLLMELHVSPCAATPAAAWVEYIPQLNAVATSRLAIEAGHAATPDTPSLGLAWRWEELVRRARTTHTIQ